ncbi:arsenate reductase ArsC [Nibrella saemangeumensis]|uniref:Arsenate reductase ArsC n=1 Tax=Nibrella saemangeumensis TaxID=1084526 RepID=A0ABP8NFE8_9BACT
MKRILVLCTGNSARSQLAQGYLQHFADTSDRGDRAEVLSAGVDPKGPGRRAVNPLAMQVMAEDGIDISHYTARRYGSNHADEYTAIPFDYVITVCDTARRGDAREQCPSFPSSTQPGVARRFHHSFTDPGHVPGRFAGAIDALTSFRQVGDEIKAYSRQFIENHLTTNSPAHA